MLVQIAEAGTLPTAECVIGQRDRNWHVDANHADIDTAGEVAGSITVTLTDTDYEVYLDSGDVVVDSFGVRISEGTLNQEMYLDKGNRQFGTTGSSVVASTIAT